MKNIDKKILVIEDKVSEIINAQTELVKAGYTDYKVVSNLSEGLELIPEYNAVLTDLFFPAGNAELTRMYSQKFLPSYEKYNQTRFKRLEKDNITFRVVKQCADVFGVTPQEYVDNLMPNFKNMDPKLELPKSVLEAARDAVIGVEDSEKYEKFLKIEENIRDGTDLPLGIIASEKAKELNIPSVVVTSTNHHDDAFSAVRDLITVPYCDNLVDGKKDWKRGIELLLR